MNALHRSLRRSGFGRVLSAAALLTLAAGAPQALGRPSAPDADRWDRGAERAPEADSREISQAELDQALAGLALYPDALLSQALIACTYPIEIVQADRWAKNNPDLKGNALAAALEAQTWDPSVKSLVNFPDVLASLSENLESTAKIGDAFVSDEKRVMDTIQALRSRARAEGNLESNDNQRVIVEPAREAAATTIIIRSARPDVIYVPVYDPVVVYGGWWWPACPPVVYCAPYRWHSGVSVWWGGPRYCGPAWGYAWGSCNWWTSSVFIDISLNSHCNGFIDRDRWRRDCDRRYGWRDGRGEWRHDGDHRRGVAYRDDRSAREFGGVSSSDTERAREGFRPQAEAGRREIERGAVTAPGAREQAEGSGRRSDPPSVSEKPSPALAKDDRAPSAGSGSSGSGSGGSGSGGSSSGGSGKGSVASRGSASGSRGSTDDKTPDAPRSSRGTSSAGAASAGTKGGAASGGEGGGSEGTTRPAPQPRETAGTVSPGREPAPAPSVESRGGRGSAGRGSSPGPVFAPPPAAPSGPSAPSAPRTTPNSTPAPPPSAAPSSGGGGRDVSPSSPSRGTSGGSAGAPSGGRDSTGAAPSGGTSSGGAQSGSGRGGSGRGGSGGRGGYDRN